MREIFTDGTIDEDSPTPCDLKQYVAYQTFTDKFIYIASYMATQLYVTGFGKTDHIVTIDILRNTDLKY